MQRNAELVNRHAGTEILSVGFRHGKSSSYSLSMLVANYFNIILFYFYNSTFLIHQAHNGVQRHFKFRARTNKRTSDWLSSRFIPYELQYHDPRRLLKLFCLLTIFKKFVQKIWKGNKWHHS